MVNANAADVASHNVIDRYIRAHGQDYRFELAKNPIEALRDRSRDNVDVGRKANATEMAKI